MTRETRHLQVSNVPESFNDEKLLTYFANYGRVQKVEKLGESLGRFVVSFVDIRTASKALASNLHLEGNQLRASFYETAPEGGTNSSFQYNDNSRSSTANSTSGVHSHETDRHFAVQYRSTNNYDRYNGNCSSGRPPARRDYKSWNGSSDDRRSYQRHNQTWEERSSGGGSHHSSSRRSANSSGRPNAERRRRRSVGSSGSRSRSPSHKSSRSSLSPGASVSSRGSRAATSRPSRHGDQSISDNGHVKRADTESPNGVATDGVIVRNLPVRSSDSSLKDGLYFTYKKLGKVLRVHVVGEAENRYGVVVFKKGLDVNKTIAETDDEMFFGSRIHVEQATQHVLDSADDNEKKPLEREIDEHHPRSSRTLYVGNLETRVSENSLKDRFGQHGIIIDVDVKNRDTPAPFAFVQYADITSVIKAIQETEANKGSKSRLKVGFGKTLQSNIVWLDDLPEVEEEYIVRKMRMYGEIQDILVDPYLHQALVTYHNIDAAVDSVKQLKARTRTIGNVYVQVDYGSAQLQDLFIDRMYRSKQYAKKDSATIPPPPTTSTVGPTVNSFSESTLSRTTTVASRPSVRGNVGTAVSSSGPSSSSHYSNGPTTSSRRDSTTKDTSSAHRSGYTLTKETNGGASTRHWPAHDKMAKAKDDGRSRRRSKSPSTRSGKERTRTSSSSSSASSSGSSSDGSSSGTETSEEIRTAAATIAASVVAPPPPDPCAVEKVAKPNDSQDDLNKLAEERDNILHMLENLGDNDDAKSDLSQSTQQRKPKLSDVFDLDWQQKKKEKTPSTPGSNSGIVDENKVSHLTINRQSSSISASFEQQDLEAERAAAESSMDDERKEGTIDFKKRKIRQFQPRKSSTEEDTFLESLTEKEPVVPEPSSKSPIESKDSGFSELNEVKEGEGKSEESLPEETKPEPTKVSIIADSLAKVFTDNTDACTVAAELITQHFGRKPTSPLTSPIKNLPPVTQAAVKSRPPVSGHHRHIPKNIPLESKDSSSSDPRSNPPKVTLCELLTIPEFGLEFSRRLRVDTRRQSGDLGQSFDSTDEPSPAFSGHFPLSRSASGSSDMVVCSEGGLPTPTTDIFGNDLRSPPFGSNMDSPGRPSLEERIKALDAKFSAIDEKMQNTRRTSIDRSSYSKYVVKKKASTPTSVWQQQSSEDSDTGRSHYKSSIFDQDIERLKRTEETFTPAHCSRLNKSADSVNMPENESKQGDRVQHQQHRSRRSDGASNSGHHPKEMKSPLSIHIPQPTNEHGHVSEATPTTPMSTGILSPPPLHGILKKTKTPTGSGPSIATTPVFPPNLSVPPPLLPHHMPPGIQPLGMPPVQIPLDPRLRKDSTSMKSPTEPVSAPPFGPNHSGSRPPFPPLSQHGKQSWQRQSIPPLRQHSVSDQKQSETPKSAYNVDPRNWGQKSIGQDQQRQEKTFGLRHDEQRSGNGNGNMNTCNYSWHKQSIQPQKQENRTQKTTGQNQKELRNKELDELFRQQAADTERTAARKELPKIKKKEKQQTAEKITSDTSADNRTEELKRREKETKKLDESEKKIRRDSKVSHDKHEKKNEKKFEKDKHQVTTKLKKPKEEEKSKKGKRKRKFSKQGSFDESNGSDSDSDSGSEQDEKKAQKSFQKSLEKILSQESDSGLGLSMYDRVKRRSSAVRVPDADKTNEFLDQLKEKRKSKKRKRVVSSDEESNSDSDSDNESPVSTKKQTTKTEPEKKARLELDDVFGVGGSSDENSDKKAHSSEGSDAEQEPEPPKKKKKVEKPTKTLKEKDETVEKSSKPPKSVKTEEKTARKKTKEEKLARKERKEKEKEATAEKVGQKKSKNKEGKKERSKEKEEKRKKSGSDEPTQTKANENEEKENKTGEVENVNSPPRLLTKAAVKAVASPTPEVPIASPGTKLPEKTLDTNEELTPDIVAALKASGEEEPTTDSGPVEVTDYAEVEIREGDRLLIVEEGTGQVQECVVTAENAETKPEPEEDTKPALESLEPPTCAIPTADADPHVKIEPQPEVKQEVEPETNEEQKTVDNDWKNVDGLAQMTLDDHQPLVEQRSDVSSSHVDEIIDDIVRGYVEIDAEKLIRMSQPTQPSLVPKPSDLLDQTVSSVASQSYAPAPTQVTQSMLTPPARPHDILRSAVPSLPTQPPYSQHVEPAVVSSAPFGFGHMSRTPAVSSAAVTSSNYEQLLLQAQGRTIDSYMAALQTAAVNQPQTSPTLSAQLTGPAAYAGGLPLPYGAPVPQVPFGVLDPQTRAFLELQQQWANARLPHPNMGGTATSLEQQKAQAELIQQQRLINMQQAQVSATSNGQMEQQQQHLQTSQHLVATTAPSIQQPSTIHQSEQTQSQHQQQQLGGKNILDKYPVRWQGNLALKNVEALVQMHYITGNHDLIQRSMQELSAKEIAANEAQILRINQRMRLEPTQLEGVQRRMNLAGEHCVLLALPCGVSANDIMQNSQKLRGSFIDYLQQKQAAGIVNVSSSDGQGNQVPTYVVHIFPPCEFSQTHLTRSANDFLMSVEERHTSYLFVVITTVQ